MLNGTPIQRGKTAEDIQHVISKVEYINSPFGVESQGLKVTWHETDTDGNILPNTGKIVGNDRIINHNFLRGTAFVPQDRTNFFNITWSGHFYAEISGNHIFVINKDESSLANISFVATNPSVTYVLTGLKGVDIVQSSFNMDTGWHSFKYSYTELDAESHTSVLFKPPTSELQYNNYYRPVSAGVVNTTPAFQAATQLEGYTTIRGSRGTAQSSQYVISVPLSPTPQDSLATSGNEVIYYYDPGAGTYVMRKILASGGGIDVDNTLLSIGRLIKISAGYQSRCTFAAGLCTNSDTNITGFYHSICENYGNPNCPANDIPSTDFIQRFEGIITDFSVKRQKAGDTLDIVCQDQLVLLQENFDKNYPDIMSYLNAGFSISGYENSNGRRVLRDAFTKKFARPKAYDAWPIGDALRDILINGGIDPSKLHGSKLVVDAVNGRHIRIKDVPFISSELDKVNLTRKALYGNPIIPGLPSEKSDDEYIWTTNFGDDQDNILKRIIDTYGYIIQLNNEGFVEIKSIDIDRGSDSFAVGSVVQDGKAIAGFYTSTSSDNIVSNVTGSKILIKTVVDSGTGVLTSSWRIPIDASPANKIPQWGINYPYDILYGTYWGPGLSGGSWDQIKYTTTRFALSVPSGTTISGAKFTYSKDTTRGGFSLTGGHRVDYTPNIECEFYFGPGTYTNGLLDSFNKNPSNLVKTGFRANDFGPVDFSKFNYVDDVDFDSDVEVTGGLYVLEVVASGIGDETIPSGIGNGRFVELNSFMFDGTADAYPYYTLEVSGLENKFFSGYSDISGFGSSTRVYPDITLREKYALKNPGDTETIKTVVEVYDSGGSLILTKETIQYSSGTKYSFDGPDQFRDYLSLIEIHPWELNSTIDSGGIIDSYSEYEVRVRSNNDDGFVNVETITAEPDAFRQSWIFDTEQNVFDSLDVNSNYANIRNDVLVVGNQVGVVTDLFTNQIINKNNPTNIYVFSRAVDYDSIYNLNSKYNIGRTKNFLIFEPGIKSQYHADWLASGSLLKYNKNRNGVKLTTPAVPFLEPYDQVYVVDKALFLSNNNDSIQYVEDFNEQIAKGKYTMDITTTPYKPWPSFTRSIIPIVDEDDEAFTDILITNLNNCLVQTGDEVKGGVCATGFNVYLSEGAGDGVNQDLVNISFTQRQEGFTTIKIINQVGETISYLVGGIENDFEVGEFRDAGLTYDIRWGGIDEFGMSKIGREGSEFISGFVVDPLSKGFYAFPDRYYVTFEVIDPYDDGKQFFINSRELDSGFNPHLDSYLVVSNGKYDHGIDIVWGPQMDGKIILDDKLELPDGSSRRPSPPRAITSHHEYRGNWSNGDPITEPLSTSRGNPVEPKINYVIFSDEENIENGNFKGIKVGVNFDESIGNFERAATFKVNVKHAVHWGIMVREPDIIASSIGNPTLEGLLKIWDVNKFGWNSIGIADDFATDNVAITGQKIASHALAILDFNGFNTVQLKSVLRSVRGTPSLDRIYGPDEVVKYGFDGTTSIGDGLPNVIQGNEMFDVQMHEWGRLEPGDRDIHRGAVNEGALAFHLTKDVPWSNKFFFHRTPLAESAPIDDYIEPTKFLIVSGKNPHIEFFYNPTTIKGGQIRFDVIPPFASENEFELFKQTLREAFWIAKWHMMADRWGDVRPVADARASFGDHWNWSRSILGNINHIHVGSSPKPYNVQYWRDDPEVAKYVKLMVMHVFQFEIEIYDNTGRGLTAELQPARIYPRPKIEGIEEDNYARQIQNRQDWQISDGGSKTENYEKSMLFGYDNFGNRQKLVFHAYWYPWDNVKNKSILPISGNSSLGLPSRLNERAWAKDWGDPYYARMTVDADPRVTDIAQGNIPTDESLIKFRPNGISNVLFYYHEGVGYGASNSKGTFWDNNNRLYGKTWRRQHIPNGPFFYYQSFGGFIKPIGFVQSHEIIGTKSSKLHYTLVYDTSTEFATSFEPEIPYAEYGMRKNIGPPYWELSLPATFTFNDIDNLTGIPNRGVKTTNG